MIVLGLAGGFNRIYENNFAYPPTFTHDSAAVIVRDGSVIAAIEEERLNRIKHTNKFPSQAIRFCLESAGTDIRDVDAIAIYLTEEFLNAVLRYNYLNHKSYYAPFADARTSILRLIKHTTGQEIPRERLVFVPHHHAHAASAFWLSGFERSLIVTVDAAGEDSSGMIFSGQGSQITSLATLPIDRSLGAFYLDVIKHLGYYQFDEYKVMGLAPYGDPGSYRELFSMFYTLLPNGDYQLHTEHLSQLFELAPLRRGDQPFAQVHADIAAALQESLEAILLHMLSFYRSTTDHTSLCMAGGVAHNCSANGKILRAGLFEQVFVQPAAHDAGCALGAALMVDQRARPQARSRALSHVYWGADIGSDQQIEHRLARWRSFIEYQPLANRSAQVAELLAGGSVIGWVQGRSEFGPRALGNRSILADPRPAHNKDIINAMVKKREAYRPFAPAILEAHISEFYDVPANLKRLPFMVFTVPTRQEKQSLLGAVTHVDGTARIQSVSREDNSAFYDLIDAFRNLTGVPILLNTSFNNNYEPIVESIDDAVVCFLTTHIHYLVIGSYLISKKELDPELFLLSSIALPGYCQLHQSRIFTSEQQTRVSYTIGNTYDPHHTVTISPEMFALLMAADGQQTLQQLLERIGHAGCHARLIEELIELWRRRVVWINPDQASSWITYWTHEQSG